MNENSSASSGTRAAGGRVLKWMGGDYTGPEAGTRYGSGWTPPKEPARPTSLPSLPQNDVAAGAGASGSSVNGSRTEVEEEYFRLRGELEAVRFRHNQEVFRMHRLLKGWYRLEDLDSVLQAQQQKEQKPQRPTPTTNTNARTNANAEREGEAEDSVVYEPLSMKPFKLQEGVGENESLRLQIQEIERATQTEVTRLQRVLEDYQQDMRRAMKSQL